MPLLRLLVTILAGPDATRACRLRVTLQRLRENSALELASSEFDLPNSVVERTRRALDTIDQQGELVDIANDLWRLVFTHSRDADLGQHLGENLTVPEMEVELVFPTEDVHDALAAVQALPWEGLPGGLDSVTKYGFAYFVRPIRPLRKPAPAKVGKLRILILVGASDSPGHLVHAIPAPAWTSLHVAESIRDALGDSVHLEIHCTDAARRGYTGSKIGIEFSLGEPDLAGRIAALLGQEWDVVHLFGHGTSSTGSGPHDAVDLGDGHLLTAATLATNLSTRTRILLLQSCSCREAFLRALGGRVDHVIGTAGKLEPKDTWAPFYQRLAKDQADFRVTAGIQEIRKSAWTDEKRERSDSDKNMCPWLIPIHYRVVDNDLPFGGEFARNRLIYANAIRPHLRTFSPLPGHGLDTAIRLSIAAPSLVNEHGSRLRPELMAPGRLPADEAGEHRPRGYTLAELIEFLTDRTIRNPPHCAMLLIGDPGGGKTTTLHQLAFDILDVDSGTVPVYVHLPTWLLNHEDRDLASLLAEIGRLFGRAAATALTSIHATATRLLLLLDGYDELAGKNDRDAVSTLLTNVSEAPLPGVFAVLASRPTALAHDPANDPPAIRALPRATLLRLEHSDQQRILRNRLGPGRGDAVAAALVDYRTPDSVRALTTTPLFLGMLADLALAQPAADDDALRTWLQSFRDRSQFYDAILETLVRGKHRRLGETGDRGDDLKESQVRERLQKLEDLALAMTSGRLRACGRDLAERHVAVDLLDQLCARSGVLQPQAAMDPDSPVQFWHRSLQEMLTARWFVRMLDTASDKNPWARLEAAVLEKVGTAAAQDALVWWSEPLALVTSALTSARRIRRLQLSDASARAQVQQWIRSLTHSNDTGTGTAPGVTLQRIGLTSLFTADARFLDDDIVLNALQDCANLDWEARRPVYALITEMPESRGLVDRIDRWVRFWSERERAALGYLQRRELAAIDACLWPMARSHDPQVRGAAVAARERVLAGFGDQDVTKIRALMRVPGKNTSYWADIPAGWLAFEDRPTRIDAGFQIARVTVTVELYQAFASGHRNSWPSSGTHPVTDVTWLESSLFCRWLSRQLGSVIRLPNKLEWEASVRGVVATRQAANERVGEPWGRDQHGNVVSDKTLASVAYCGRGWGSKPTSVATLHANEHGVFDLLGNVWEWEETAYEYGKDLSEDLRGGPRPSGHCQSRGGACWNDHEDCGVVHVGVRGLIQEEPDTGFRLVCVFPQSS